MNAEDRIHKAVPQSGESFLFRVTFIAAPLSLLLMLAPVLVAAGTLGAASPGGNLNTAVMSVIFTFTVLAMLALVAFVYALLVVAAVGAPLWYLFRRTGAQTRARATKYGAIGGGIIVLIEAVFVANGMVAQSSATFTWTKFAVDGVCTIGIGALSALWAWRPPTPPSGTTGSQQASPSPPPR